MKLKEEQTLKGHNGRVWGCSWSPSGNLLATCGEDANVRYDHCLDFETLLLLLLPYFCFFQKSRCCSDDDSNSNLPAKKCAGAITQPSYQLNTFHHAMNVYYDSLSLSISFSPQLKTCHQAEKTHRNKSTYI